MAGLIPRGRKLDEQGMTTAEYAVGTLAATGVAGVLWMLVRSPEFQQLILALVRWIFDIVMRMS